MAAGREGAGGVPVDPRQRELAVGLPSPEAVDLWCTHSPDVGYYWIWRFVSWIIAVMLL